jgi:hypothetical protein
MNDNYKPGGNYIKGNLIVGILIVAVVLLVKLVMLIVEYFKPY